MIKIDGLNHTIKTEEKQKTTFMVKNINIGEDLFLCAGPCAISSKEELEKIAVDVKKAKCNALRGGAFKPRTSPYSFQGIGEEGLKIIKDIADKKDLISVSEITDIRDIELFEKYVDIIQVGARNMQNFALLRELGKLDKPILLKRGFSSTISEFLHCAEYIMNEGNEKVILCERGIRTFNEIVRNTLDLGTVALLQEITHLPIIVDPSHGTGLDFLVPKMAKASIAIGVDGLIIESHTNPEEAISDKEQTISTKVLKDIVDNIVM